MNSNIRKTTIFLLVIFILYTFYMGISMTKLFYTGMHNVDLSYNMISIENQLNINLMDRNSVGNLWNASEMYKTGLKQIRKGSKGTNINLIGLFIGLVGLILFTEKNIKNTR